MNKTHILSICFVSNFPLNNLWCQKDMTQKRASLYSFIWDIRELHTMYFDACLDCSYYEQIDKCDMGNLMLSNFDNHQYTKLKCALHIGNIKLIEIQSVFTYNVSAYFAIIYPYFL